MKREMLLEDFRSALIHLENALELDAVNDVIKAGCIQYFEFCFELAWKTVKTLADEQGVQDCNSPKSTLKYAFKAGLIQDEEIWLDMLNARNNMSHTYNAKNAIDIYKRLGSFSRALNELCVVLMREN